MKTVAELVQFVNAVGENGETANGPLWKCPDNTPDHLAIYTRPEMELLAKYAREIPKGGTAVEIGVYVGHTASILLQLEEDLMLDIFLIDNWSWMMPEARIAFERMVDQHFPETFFHRMWMLSADAHRLLNPSHPKSQILPMPNIDFIHIDGNHNYDGTGVDLDCKLWLPLLRPGGVAVFHDADHSPVWQAIEEFCPGWEREYAGRTEVRRKPL